MEIAKNVERRRRSCKPSSGSVPVIEVYRTFGQWYWKVKGCAPAGPFETKEEACDSAYNRPDRLAPGG